MFSIGNGGIGVIERTLGQFERVKIDLQNGVTLCEDNIAVQESKIKETEKEKKLNEASIKRATKAISNIDKLFGEA